MSGSDGCNQYTGTFHTDGSSIEVGQLATTLMGCDPPRMAQAQAFAAALSGATEWRLTETNELELRGHGDILAHAGRRHRSDRQRRDRSSSPGRRGCSWTSMARQRRCRGRRRRWCSPTTAWSPGSAAATPTAARSRRMAARSRSARWPRRRWPARGPAPTSNRSTCRRSTPSGRWEIMPSGQLVLTGPQVLHLPAGLTRCAWPTSASATPRQAVRGAWPRRSTATVDAGSTWRRMPAPPVARRAHPGARLRRSTAGR